MKQVIGMAMLVFGASGYAFAGITAPEIDATSAIAAVALLSGGLLVLRSRRRRS